MTKVYSALKFGIVGHEATKFTPNTEAAARAVIRELLAPPGSIAVSGHCHLGGVDIYAEEEADALGREKLIFPPKRHTWEGGYKDRNILVAEHSDVLHVIVVATYPETYHGMRFPLCYHCKTTDHVKSGGCWTGKYAQRLGKEAVWHTIT